MSDYLCAYIGCQNHCSTSQKFYKGKRFCPSHYFASLNEEIASEHAAWELGTAPSDRMRYLVGRVFIELGNNEGDSYLSSSRISDRGFNFIKTEDGGEFSITRHLNAWSKFKPMLLIVERWRFNIINLQYELIEKREWKSGDPDIGFDQK